MPNKASKPRNMVDACKALESADATKNSRSVRILIPRMIVAMYEIRNNRGVGHVGGEVNPNGMDARLVLECSKWIIAELIREFHAITTVEAAETIERLTERTLPVVWQVGTTKRVLDASLSKKAQTLLLLYSSNGPVLEKDLRVWVEHSNPSTYRRDVLRKLHQERLVEYDLVNSQVHLTPLGVEYVEEHLPLSLERA